jgi:hypothetical protein
MAKKWFLVLLAAIFFNQSIAQPDSSHLRISLLTCGPGDEEVYEVFGHTAIRIVDSIQNTDIVYNYGTFQFGPDFQIQFMRGKLKYCLGLEPYWGFMQQYVEAKRSVEEQVLLLNQKQKLSMRDFLNWNAQTENKFYKYDFFFDNCATRIRDVFPGAEVYGKDFKYADVRPKGKSLTFRDIINSYFYRDYWTRMGVNILLGSKIDKVMSNDDIMFLPDYLRDGLKGATVNGKQVATPPELLLAGGILPAPGINPALLLSICIALLTILGLTVRQLRLLGKVMTTLLLSVTGLLGCLILVMWFATDHQGCSNNYNILWLLPTNMVIAFFNPKGKGRYALVGMIFIFIVLLLHLFHIQGLLFAEFSPILLALLFIFGNIYRKSIANPTIQHAANK